MQIASPQDNVSCTGPFCGFATFFKNLRLKCCRSLQQIRDQAALLNMSAANRKQPEKVFFVTGPTCPVGILCISVGNALLSRKTDQQRHQGAENVARRSWITELQLGFSSSKARTMVNIHSNYFNQQFTILCEPGQVGSLQTSNTEVVRHSKCHAAEK